MSNDNIVFIDLDTHELNTEAAYYFDRPERLPQHLVKIPSTQRAFTLLAQKFQSKIPPVLHPPCMDFYPR